MITKKVLCEFADAYDELGHESFNRHFDYKFGMPVLNFVNTLVFNFPQPCYANCKYCIDKNLRKTPSIKELDWLDVSMKLLREFRGVDHITLTGGNPHPEFFDELMDSISVYSPNASITYNTNGIGLNTLYNLDEVRYLNLHRNAIDPKINEARFHIDKHRLNLHNPIPYIASVNEMCGENTKLTLRVTVDETFKLNDFIQFVDFGYPIFINRMQPGTLESGMNFSEILNYIIENGNGLEPETRRRNAYFNTEIEGVPVRIGMGDSKATRVPGRYPTYLNVAILHRSGVIAGSWYEDDKTLYDPRI